MAQDTFFKPKSTLNIGGNLMKLTRPHVMGIINITPDSFFKASRKQANQEIIASCEAHLNAGASFIDLGAYSTRPGARNISEEQELERLIPAVHLISKSFPQALISVDTFRANVAEQAVAAGAHMVNDVSGGTLDAELYDRISTLNVPYILTHMRGTPQTMQNHTEYDAFPGTVVTELSEKLNDLKRKGLNDILIDPGFGFAKTIDQNFKLLNNLEALHTFQLPLVIGVSRKSMVWKTLKTSAEHALNGTTVLHTIALLKGAQILRVHDTTEAVECIELIQKLHLA